MPAVIGIWIALAGVPAVLAGLSGMFRIRRLRRDGVRTWAVAVPQPPAADDDSGSAALQYTLADGSVLEKLTPAPVWKAAAGRPGRSVLIWYDPADPLDILVYGREGRVPDLVFVIAGLVFMLIGAGIAVFTP
jgi:hypothetical protein